MLQLLYRLMYVCAADENSVKTVQIDPVSCATFWSSFQGEEL